MNLRTSAIALVIAAVALSLLGCARPAAPGASSAPAPATPSTPATGAKGVIVFDMSHGEVFSPDDSSELGQSRIVEEMKAAGFEVRINTSPITTETLDGAAAIYVPGPMRPFIDSEKTAIDDYVARGGTVLLSIHVPFPVLGTPARWGLPVGTAVMQAFRPVDPIDRGVFLATGIAEDPITEGVSRVLVVSGWAVRVEPTKLAKGSLVVTSGPGVVVDGNNDRKITSADPRPPFGVVGVAPVGYGRVIVLGDDAIFANIAIDQADNPILLGNILKLIAAPRPV
jgi:hypothetical protein